jgi:putative endonuclease
MLSVLKRIITPEKTEPRHDLGRRGESAAARLLRAKGYRIIAWNYDCPAGEIDLIATQGATIVFVEVKSRTDATGKDADHTVTSTQRERITRAAQYFLRRADSQNRPARFDVITVYFPPSGEPVVEHFENAFVP